MINSKKIIFIVVQWQITLPYNLQPYYKTNYEYTTQFVSVYI